jgi:hypothetical protein
MKKNFFKKLSFVLALAMIVSVISPAASAFAAAAPKLNSTKKYLSLGGVSAPSKFDFNVLNSNTKTYKYSYKSSKTAVATVSSGTGVVTAKTVGTTTITCTITTKKTGKTYKKLTATVSVKDGMDSITLTNVPDKAIKVDVANDFGRTFVTESGSTTKTSSITRYAVDSDKAVINETTGVFKATEAGEYNVRVLGFKSTADYKAWLATGDFNSDSKVVASDSAKVTVAPSIVETTQVDKDTFTVKFDSNMSKTDVTKTAAVYQLLNDKLISSAGEKVKSFSLDAETGKVLTIDMYAAFNQKATYKFVYGDLNDTFEAASTTIDDVDHIVFDDFNVNVTTGTGENMNAKVYAVDKNGVRILEGTDFAQYLTYTQVADTQLGFVSGNMMYVYKEGNAVATTATLTYYRYDSTSKTYNKFTSSDAAVATGVKTDTTLNASTLKFAVAAAEPSLTANVWVTTTPITVAANDNGLKIFTQYKTNDMAADANPLVDSTATRFFYQSTDLQKLNISGNNFIPVAAGNVTVIVKTADQKTVLGAFDVVISSARALASVSPVGSQVVTVGNNNSYGETGVVTVAAVDTLGTPIQANVVNAVEVGGDLTWVAPANAQKPTVTVVRLGENDPTSANYGKQEIQITGAGATEGYYQLTVKFNLGGVTREVPVQVQVLDGNNNKTITQYKVELGSGSMDIKDVAATSDVTIRAYGYNSNGVRVARLNADQYSVVVKKSDGSTLDAARYSNTALHAVTKTGSVLEPLAKDTYAVFASVSGSTVTGRVNGAQLNVANYVVSDSNVNVATIASTTVLGLNTDTDTVKELVMTAFNFSINGTTVDGNAAYEVTEVTYTDGTVAVAARDGLANTALGRDYNIVSVKITKEINATTDIVYTFNVGQVIAIR